MTATGAARADAGLLRPALELAARGWRVFPCAQGGKRPALRGNWQDMATGDPGRVRAWWARAGYNIGIACGPSGLIVLDLDVRSGLGPGGAGPATGVEALASLCQAHDQPFPPITYWVRTPSGGAHLYYAAPAGRVRNSARRLGPLIDVRADGGYVVGAASSIDGRPYTVRDGRAPAPLPAWIAVLLRDPPAQAARPAPAGAQGTAYAMAAAREEAELVAAARPGTRNDTLNRAAFNLGQLTAAGLLPARIARSALASAAERAGLPADEARRTIKSGLAAGARHPRNG